MLNNYYVDTCIWLNLFKKEGDEKKGIPYWKLAEKFIEKIMQSKECKIFYSGIILRELQIKLREKEYFDRRSFIQREPYIVRIEVVKEDEIEARKLESFYDFEISFYDLVHIHICKRNNFILVTRDKQLIIVASDCGVIARKPEELL